MTTSSAPALVRARLVWTPRDERRWVTWAAVGGLLAAAAMAAFGLPPVELHGILHRFGIMDPLCGGTRSVRFAARGEWARSWTYNPLGVLLVAGAAVVLARAAVGVLARRWLDLRLPAAWWRAAVVVGVVLLVLLDVRQQLRADLLIAP